MAFGQVLLVVLVDPVDDESPTVTVGLSGDEDRPHRTTPAGADDAVDGVGIDAIDPSGAVPADLFGKGSTLLRVATLHDQAA